MTRTRIWVKGHILNQILLLLLKVLAVEDFPFNLPFTLMREKNEKGKT